MAGWRGPFFACVLPGVASYSRGARCTDTMVVVFGLELYVGEYHVGLADNVKLFVRSARAVGMLLEC